MKRNARCSKMSEWANNYIGDVIMKDQPYRFYFAKVFWHDSGDYVLEVETVFGDRCRWHSVRPLTKGMIEYRTKELVDKIRRNNGVGIPDTKALSKPTEGNQDG